MKQHKEDDTPGCCKLGDKYISWIVDLYIGEQPHEMWTGWGMTVDVEFDLRTYEKVNFCPFCGTSLAEL